MRRQVMARRRFLPTCTVTLTGLYDEPTGPSSVAFGSNITEPRPEHTVSQVDADVSRLLTLNLGNREL